MPQQHSKLQRAKSRVDKHKHSRARPEDKARLRLVSRPRDKSFLRDLLEIPQDD